MAADTDLQLQHQVIYSIYVRAHTPEGTFRAVIPTWTASPPWASILSGSCPSTPSAWRRKRAPWAAPTPTGITGP